MNKTKLSTVLFSLAVIAALVLAAVPAPVFALSASGVNAVQLTAPVATYPSVVVCRSVHRWYHGHWIVVRVCHKVP